MIKIFDSQRRILLAVGASLLLITSALITDTEIEGDAQQNIRMALNLERHGIISLDQPEPRRASMKREPVPIFFLAAGMAGVDLLLGEGIDATDYEKGTRVRLLKHLDLIWILTIYIGTFVGMRFIGRYAAPALPVMMIVAVLLAVAWWESRVKSSPVGDESSADDVILDSRLS